MCSSVGYQTCISMCRIETDMSNGAVFIHIASHAIIVTGIVCLQGVLILAYTHAVGLLEVCIHIVVQCLDREYCPRHLFYPAKLDVL